MIGDKEYTFNESESIFFMTEPIEQRKCHNTTEGCATCGERWKKMSDLKGSHCTFCGMSNCKKCLCKTRPFRLSKKQQQGGSERQRGQICRLCDRKFIIKDMVAGSLEEIRT